MTKTPHPCAGMGLTKRQREVFESILIDPLPRATSKTFDALVAHGLIERTLDKLVGRDRFGVISLPQYAMTGWAHYQFCKWAAENTPDNEETGETR